MATIPNLFLKWRAVRELIGVPQSDAQIGATIFGEGREGGPKFSKLLYGDYGCPPEIGAELIKIINGRIQNFRKGRSLDGTPNEFSISDIEEPLYPFIRKLIVAGDVADEQALHRLQEALLDALKPKFGIDVAAQLVIERYELNRAFAGMVPSGGGGPIAFQVGRHKGRLAVHGIDREPAMAYTFLARDARAGGHRSWDLNWNETVLWVPSPSKPKLVDGTLHLMPEAAEVLPIPGRFIATTVLLWDADFQDALDPRGATAVPAALDEAGTSRFLTNLRKLAKRHPASVTTSSAEYMVLV